MSSSIHYNEMIKDMDDCTFGRSQRSFELKYVKNDARRGTGGQIVHVEKGQKCGLPYHCADHEMRGVVDMESRKKTAFHLRLAIEYNGMTVYW